MNINEMLYGPGRYLFSNGTLTTSYANAEQQNAGNTTPVFNIMRHYAYLVSSCSNRDASFRSLERELCIVYLCKINLSLEGLGESAPSVKPTCDSMDGYSQTG